MNALKIRCIHGVFRPRVLLASLLALSAIVASLSCGGDDKSTATATPKAGTTSGAPASQAGPGGITVTSGPISGQNKKMLLVNAVPESGGASVAEACIPITSDRFTAPATTLTNVQAGGQGPCSGAAAKSKLPEGTYTITAGVYAPPAQSPEKQSTQTVQVKGDITVQIDGAALSK